MDVDYLLIILPIIIFLGVSGLLLVIWQYGRSPQKQSAPPASEVDIRTVSETTTPSAWAALTYNSTGDQPSNPSALKVNGKPVTPHPQAALIILQLLATQERPYQGYELIQTLSSTGFHYGEMNIFHYYDRQNEKNQRLFSLASAIEPGSFDLTCIAEIYCPGLCLFMSPNKTSHALRTFELMLETAQLLIQDLGGTLCDQQHEPLTAEIITRYRSQLPLYTHA